MLVFRIKKGQNFFGRSYCDFTGEPLKPIDLIPVFSFLIFKGRCRECKKKLPILYPIIEFLMGLLSLGVFVLVYFQSPLAGSYDFFQILFNWFPVFIICFGFVFFAYYDLLYWEVDLVSVIVFLCFLLLLNVINYFYPLWFLGSSLENILAGGLLAGLIFVIFKITKGGGMGGGDIFIFTFTGLVLGLFGGLLALVISSLSGSIVGLILAKSKHKKIKGFLIQLAPFISFGTLVVFFFKDFLFKILLPYS